MRVFLNVTLILWLRVGNYFKESDILRVLIETWHGAYELEKGPLICHMTFPSAACCCSSSATQRHFVRLVCFVFLIQSFMLTLFSSVL